MHVVRQDRSAAPDRPDRIPSHQPSALPAAVWADIGLAPDWEASHFGITEAIRRDEIDRAVGMTVQQIEEATDRVLAFLKKKSKPNGV